MAETSSKGSESGESPAPTARIATLLTLAALTVGFATLASAEPPPKTPTLLRRIVAPKDPQRTSRRPRPPLGPRFDADVAMAKAAPAVANYRIKVRLDPLSHELKGTTRIQWTNTSKLPTKELYLHRYLNAFRNQHSVFMRSHLGPGRAAEIPSSWGLMTLKTIQLGAQGKSLSLKAQAAKTTPGDREDRSDLRLELPVTIAPGQKLELNIRFEATLPAVTARTGFSDSFHMVGQWFPKIARREPNGAWRHFPFHRLSEFYADFGNYDVTIDVPAAFHVIGSGKRISKQTKGSRTQFHYKQNNVHDFAFAAWDNFHLIKRKIAGVDVEMGFPLGHERSAERQLRALHTAITCYGRRFGRYPYDHLNVVYPPSAAPEAGGMEYPTLITTGGRWYGPPFARFQEAVTVHEFGHQYFYGLLASDEHRFPFLDEGLNSYAEIGCMDELFPEGSAANVLGLSLGIGPLHREGAQRALGDDFIAQGSAHFPTAGVYGGLVYSGTASLLSTLANIYGKKPVDRALGRYARRYRFSHPSPDDLIGAFRSEISPQAAENLRAGLFEPITLNYRVLAMGSRRRSTPAGYFEKADGQLNLESGSLRPGYISWVAVGRQGNPPLPVEIELIYKDGKRQKLTWSGQDRWVKFITESPAKLERVTLDPDRKLWVERRRRDNTKAFHAAPFPWRPFERLSFWLSELMWMLAP